MKRRAVSWALAAVALTLVAVAGGIGASVYYLGSGVAASQTMATETGMSTTSQGANMPTSTMATSTMATSSMTTSAMISTVSSSGVASTVSSSNMASTSTQTSVQSSSGQGAQLSIEAMTVSHSLGGYPVAGTCGSAMPGSSASYIEVTNTGTVPTVINTIDFNYVDMVTEMGAPSGACTVGAGATAYITLAGIGTDVATSGEMFSVSVIGTNGGFANAGGNFG